MRHLKPITLLFLLMCVTPALVLAQTDCPAIATQALAAVDEYCQDAGRNQACYGNLQLTAEPQADVTDFTFDAVGDLTSVADIKSLKLNPMDTTAGTWGVVMLRLQANLPDTLPGQNVTVLIFGDVQIDNAVEPSDENYNPMQAFYFKSGVGDAPCEEAPESGMIVQTPEGAGQVSFTVNGVEVAMGSTIFFQSASADDDSEMTVNALEGSAYVEKEGRQQLAVAGTRLRVPRQQAGSKPPTPTSDDEVEFGEPYNDQPLQKLPVGHLGRRIDVPPPLNQSQVQDLNRCQKAGKPLCGEDPLPSCDHLPPRFGGSLLPPDQMPMNQMPCVVRVEGDNQKRTAREKRPFCDQLSQAEQDKLPCDLNSDTTAAPSQAESRPACNQVFNPTRRDNGHHPNAPGGKRPSGGQPPQGGQPGNQDNQKPPGGRKPQGGNKAPLGGQQSPNGTTPWSLDLP